MPSYEEERIAIYSYRASLRWAYVACLMISTLILGSIAAWIELAVKTEDTWYDTYYAILAGLGLSGLVSIFITIFVLEVGTVLADIVGRRKAEAERDEERERADQAEKRAAKAEAEVERLRRIIERNGNGVN